MDTALVSIIIPCYNEETDIKKNVDIVKDYLKDDHCFNYQIIVVNDGSKDNTGAVINSINGIIPLSYTPNRGKGYAIRYGMDYALNKLASDYIIFMDADLSTNLDAIGTSLGLLNSGYDMVIASRHDKDSNITVKQPLKRRFISKCSRIIIRSMFRFGVKDTQCGFKGMNKEMVHLILEKAKMDRFSFDVEWLYIAKINKKSYKAFPVIWKDDRGSTVSAVSSSVQFFKDLFKIKKNKKLYK